MATLEAGKLRHRVVLQSPTVTRDEAGGVVSAWADVATVWAEVVPFTGREKIAAGAEQNELDTRIRIRYRADVDAGWRVLWRGRMFEVQGPPVNVGGVDVLLELLCTSRTVTPADV